MDLQQSDDLMKIIINCDDLGYSETVNDTILDLMEEGRVTSATVMMNAPAVEDAVRRLEGLRENSFGVHLNVSEFAPLSGHPGLRPLLDENGTFSGSARHIPLTFAVRQGVYAEWCAQIERAREFGVPISHLDSHHHVHTRPSLLHVLNRVQKKFGIRKVRLRRNVSGITHPMRTPRRARNFAWNFALRHYLHAQTTDGFTAFSTFHERLQAGVGWQGSIELMCHPGSDQFAAETMLLSGEWKEQLAKDAQLISYNQLD